MGHLWTAAHLSAEWPSSPLFTDYLPLHKCLQAFGEARKGWPVCTQAVDVARIWDLVLNTAAAASVTPSGPGIAAQLNGSGPSDVDAQLGLDSGSRSQSAEASNEHMNRAAVTTRPQVPTRVALGGRNGLQMLLLPTPQARDDPLAIVDLCRAAEVGLSLFAPFRPFAAGRCKQACIPQERDKQSPPWASDF